MVFALWGHLMGGNNEVDTMVEVQNLSKFYGNVQAVQDISFTIQPGELVGFVGPNGAGKSTTLSLIMGDPNLGRSTDGKVHVCGHDAYGEGYY